MEITEEDLKMAANGTHPLLKKYWHDRAVNAVTKRWANTTPEKRSEMARKMNEARRKKKEAR
jgi:hypothetical protein